MSSKQSLRTRAITDNPKSMMIPSDSTDFKTENSQSTESKPTLPAITYDESKPFIFQRYRMQHLPPPQLSSQRSSSNDINDATTVDRLDNLESFHSSQGGGGGVLPQLRSQRVSEHSIFSSATSLQLSQQNQIIQPSRMLGANQRSKSVKDLSTLEYLRQQRAISRQNGEFYNLKDSNVYKNYKYEKVVLNRREFQFLAKKPLDFARRSLLRNDVNDSKAQLKTETTIENQRRQREIIDYQSKLCNETNNNNDSLTLEHEPISIQEIRQHLFNQILNAQQLAYPFERRTKAAEDLKKLDAKIQRSHEKLSLSSSKQHNKTSNTVPINQQLELQVLPTTRWISPLTKHERMKSQNNQNGSEAILKCELNESTINSSPRLPKLNSKHLISSKNVDNLQQSPVKSERKLSVNIIELHREFKGKGENMKSLNNLKENQKPKSRLVTGEVIVNHVQKQSQYLRLAHEFNRLIEIDRNERAIHRTKRIQTKCLTSTDQYSGVSLVQEKLPVPIEQQQPKESNDMNQNVKKKNAENSKSQQFLKDVERSLSKEIFLRETQFFSDSIRKEGEIRNRILQGISNQIGGINFEGYLKFYKIFLFQNTDKSILIDFLIKYFCSSKDCSNHDMFAFSSDCSNTSSYKVSCQTTKLQFMDSLELLSNHCNLLDGKECFAKWKSSIENQESLSNVDTLSSTQIETIFQSGIIQPEMILKLLFS